MCTRWPFVRSSGNVLGDASTVLTSIVFCVCVCVCVVRLSYSLMACSFSRRNCEWQRMMDENVHFWMIRVTDVSFLLYECAWTGWCLWYGYSLSDNIVVVDNVRSIKMVLVFWSYCFGFVSCALYVWMFTSKHVSGKFLFHFHDTTVNGTFLTHLFVITTVAVSPKHTRHESPCEEHRYTVNDEDRIWLGK